MFISFHTTLYIHVEDFSWPRGDTKFLFECSNVRNIVQHEKRNFVSPSDHVISSLLYKIHKYLKKLNHKCLAACKYTASRLVKNDITRVDKHEIITGGIAFLSICYHSVYHLILYNKRRSQLVSCLYYPLFNLLLWPWANHVFQHKTKTMYE